jgi:hypothetical protein
LQCSINRLMEYCNLVYWYMQCTDSLEFLISSPSEFLGCGINHFYILLFFYI